MTRKADIKRLEGFKQELATKYLKIKTSPLEAKIEALLMVLTSNERVKQQKVF